jgi:hypothetical protein
VWDPVETKWGDLMRARDHLVSVEGQGGVTATAKGDAGRGWGRRRGEDVTPPVVAGDAPERRRHHRVWQPRPSARLEAPLDAAPSGEDRDCVRVLYPL